MSTDLRTWRRDRLGAAANKLGGDAELGRQLGHKNGAQVGHMRAGRRPITEKTIERIEAIRGFAGWFAPPDGHPLRVETMAPNYGPPDVVRVPLLANAGSMGAGNDELHEDVMLGMLTLSPSWVERHVRPSANSALRFIHAYGESMAPTFNDGDVLLVDTNIRTPSVDGVYVLRANDRLYIKRVRQRMDGCYEVSSDNPTVKTVDVLNGSHELGVAGRVVWAWNGRKL